MLDNNPGQQKTYDGWDSIREIEKEGNRDDIYGKPTRALDRGYREGRYSAGFYVQAAGREPPILDTGIRQQDGRGIQTYGDRPGVPATNPEHDALNAEMAQTFRQETPEKALQQHPELAPAYGFVRACAAKAEADGLNEAQRIERGDVPSVQIREEREVKAGRQHDHER